MADVRLVQYDEVPFRSSTIPAALIERGGRQVIVVHAKSTCDRLGIAWQPQHRAITSHPVWSRGIITMMTPLSSGNETLMLELRYWLLWLANIDPRRVNEASSELLIAYQEEAAEVLEQHFLGVTARKQGFRIPQSLPEALRLAADALEQKALLEAKLAEQRPLVTFAETCLNTKDSILVRELAKVASKQGLITGEKRLYRKLREWGLILPNSTEPSQRAMEAGYFEVIQRPVPTPYGEILSRTTKVTPKGQVYIIERLRNELNRTA